MRKLTFAVLITLLSACASGSVLVTGVKRDRTNPEYVRIYTQPPSGYDVIGIVKASSGNGMTEQGDLDYALAELKAQAAKVGANGIILTANSRETSTSAYYVSPITPGTMGTVIPSTSSKAVLEGLAVFVTAP